MSGAGELKCVTLQWPAQRPSGYGCASIDADSETGLVAGMNPLRSLLLVAAACSVSKKTSIFVTANMSPRLSQIACSAAHASPISLAQSKVELSSARLRLRLRRIDQADDQPLIREAVDGAHEEEQMLCSKLGFEPLPKQFVTVRFAVAMPIQRPASQSVILCRRVSTPSVVSIS